jgi:hypothetical protein
MDAEGRGAGRTVSPAALREVGGSRCSVGCLQGELPEGSVGLRCSHLHRSCTSHALPRRVCTQARTRCWLCIAWYTERTATPHRCSRLLGGCSTYPAPHRNLRCRGFSAAMTVEVGTDWSAAGGAGSTALSANEALLLLLLHCGWEQGALLHLGEVK